MSKSKEKKNENVFFSTWVIVHVLGPLLSPAEGRVQSIPLSVLLSV